MLEKIKELVKRYEDYTGHFNIPHEWGERAFRGWMVCEIFNVILKWPYKNTIFGEVFDTLFVDDQIKPKVYLETKKPGRGLAESDQFEKRISLYGTLRYAIITDGRIWERLELANGKTVERLMLEISEANKTRFNLFFEPLAAKSFIYGMR